MVFDDLVCPTANKLGNGNTFSVGEASKVGVSVFWQVYLGADHMFSMMYILYVVKKLFFFWAEEAGQN